MKMPGFLKNQNSSSVRPVIVQLRRSSGSSGGFWLCFGCVAGCTLVTGGDFHACLDACVNAGACEATALTARGQSA